MIGERVIKLYLHIVDIAGRGLMRMGIDSTANLGRFGWLVENSMGSEGFAGTVGPDHRTTNV